MPSAVRSWPWLSALFLVAGCGLASQAPVPAPYKLTPSAVAPPRTDDQPSPPPAVPTPLPSPRARQAAPTVRGEMPPYPYPTPPLQEVAPNEVAGLVLSQGNPAVGIPLTVMSNRSGRTYKVKTDEQGQFRISNLPAGEYYAHYYNDSDNNKVGYWRTHDLSVTDQHGAAFPAWDVFLVGMKNQPPQGASGAFPLSVEFEPYPLAITYRLRIHNAGGPGGKPLFISDKTPAKGVSSYTFSGVNNQDGGQIGTGTCLWGYQWDAGIAGEGGDLFQDVVIAGAAPVASEATTPGLRRFGVLDYPDYP